MPSLATLFFKTAIVFLVIGIAMGLQMAISGTHNVIGAHAHANLLGWVTMAIFGGYYALNPSKATSRLANLQYLVYTTGVAVIVPSLYLLYLGYTAFEPLTAISSLVIFLGVLMFGVVVYSKEPAPRALPAE
ncbi:hypothetical protein [Chelativorans alearense]|uniref:hypothetical protein n=1 Tax=Chelativorans alearense TaxID=2681495 RepID=UPI0013D81759|nr:hypothetical protein [Chelativorans alearense]